MNKRIVILIVMIMACICLISMAVQSIPGAKLYANGIYFYKEATVLEKVNNSYKEYSIKVNLNDHEVSYFTLTKHEYAKILANDKIYILFKASPKDNLELVSIITNDSEFKNFINKNEAKGIMTLAYNDENLNTYQIKY